MSFYDQRLHWAVKTVEDGPRIFYALTDSLDAALASLRIYEPPIPARGPRTFYVVLDMRDLQQEIREAYGPMTDDQHQPAAPVAPSAEAKVADHVFVRRVCCERCAFWWQVESKRTYCERPYEEHAGSRPATTPPDHQAGDER